MFVWAHSWQSLRDTFPARRFEWFASLVMFNLGMVFFINPTIFSGNPAWQHLAKFATQEQWGWGCVAVGSARLVVLLVNGAYSRSPHARSILAFLSCFAWWQLAIGLWPNLSVGTAIFPAILFFDASAALRVAGEAAWAEAGIERAKKNGHSPDR